MSARGFTLVELLIAMLVTLLISAAALAMAISARQAFEAGPQSMDVTRHAREGLESLATAMRTAGGAFGSGAVDTMAGAVPPVWPLRSLSADLPAGFHAVRVIRAVDAGGGRLQTVQVAPGESLSLEPDVGCPATPGVCGVNVDYTAVVFDRRGHLDLFEVAAVDPALGRLMPRVALTRAYLVGALVRKVRSERYGLVPQPDGSSTLTRRTLAGASEPVVDGLVSLDLTVWGEAAAPVMRPADTGPGLASYGLPPPPASEEDPDGVWPPGEHCMAAIVSGRPVTRLVEHASAGLVRLEPEDFEDGPWCPNDLAPSRFDADLFRIRRVDIRVRVEALSALVRGAAGSQFARGGAAGSAAERQVIDLVAETRVFVRGR